MDDRSKNAERQADAYSGDLILPPFMIGPKLERMGEISLDGIAELAGKFKASAACGAVRTAGAVIQDCRR